MQINKNIDFLRIPTDVVNPRDGIQHIVDALLTEMEERNALGLAANQLNFNESIIVFKYHPNPPICIVNPRIIKQQGKQIGEEGCLSISGKLVTVERPEKITVIGFNRYMKPIKYKFTGLTTRVVCHEVDHTLGKLIIDYIKY